MVIQARAFATFVIVFLCLIAPAFARDHQAQNTSHFTVADMTPAMRVAIRRARDNLPAFLHLAVQRSPDTSNFAIKYGIPTPRGSEYVWAVVRAVDGSRIMATIDAEIRWSTAVRDGDSVTVESDEVIDWMYVDRTRMHGNATLCALEADQPSARRATMIVRVRLDCSWLPSAHAETAPRAPD